MSHFTKNVIKNCFFAAFFIISTVQAQMPWTYRADMDIAFPQPDSIVVPFLCTVDNQDNLWVISSSTSAPGAMNALYKAAPGDRVFTLVDDYSNNLNVESTRGITTIGDTVFVTARQPGTPVPQVAIMLEYPNGDANARIEYTAGGYGTWVQGLAANKDKFIYAGIAYLTSIRVYDFTDGSSNRSRWVPIDPLSSHPNEPGGHDGSSLISKIRDVAVIPGADYSDPLTPFFSSRESDTTGQHGGIAVWTGGTQTSPIDYSGQRVTDVASDLSWLWWTPYGITCDSSGNLYACGTDTMRSWVKSYSIYGNFAVENEEFPCKTSKSQPDPNGAELTTPTDIALSLDQNTAYVVDMDEHKAFVFTRGTVGIENHKAPIISGFNLKPNYPNPFNPKTTIQFEIDKAGIAELAVYNLLGEKVDIIFNEHKNAGNQQVQYYAEQLPSGIYYYRLSANGRTAVRKMILMK